MVSTLFRHATLLLVIAALTGCSGVQSPLDPAGREAEWIAQLFVWMAIGVLVIWLGMIALALLAPHRRPFATARHQTLFIAGGGVVFPVLVLVALIGYGLSGLPGMLAPAAAGGLSLEVSGVQWWWRVRYFAPGLASVETANEIRLPVGTRVDIRLLSEDVIHSFWMPPVAGKLDMIPGRLNRLSVEPTRTGTFRGACAEFCGPSHARMNFTIIVMERGAFDAWLASESRPALDPRDPTAQRGRTAFVERGCGTCHTVRGTESIGRAGPDLTHVGSRHTMAAGTLPLRQDEIQRWITQTELLKPGAHMPAFAVLPDDVVAEIAAYLMQLK